MTSSLSSPPRTVLALVAHPDDAEYFAGGTLAGFARAGARVVIVVATDGRRGSYKAAADELAVQRGEEMRRAAQVLGAEPPTLLGFPDLELDALAPRVLRREFIGAIRRHRPDVLVAQDPYTLFEPHPDHRAVAWAAYEAVAFASLPLMHPEQLVDGLTPHYVTEKYFYGTKPPIANRVVDISETIDAKVAALCAHSSQVTFLVAGVLQQAEMAGLDPCAYFGAAAADPAALLDWAMRTDAAEVGRAAGMAYAEAFRYVRFFPLVEAMLAGTAPSA